MEDNKKELNQVDETNEIKPDSSTDVVENAIEVEDAKTDVRTDARPEVNEEVYDGVNRNSGCFGSFLRLMLIIGFLVGFVWFTLEFIAPSEERVEVYTKIEEATGFTVPTLNKVTVSDKQAMAEAEEDAAEQAEQESAEQAAEQAEQDAEYAELDSYVDPVINQVITSGMSDYDKAKAVYDWMCQNISYDYAGVESNTEIEDPIEVMQTGLADCQGYSELFDYFMMKLGIPCKVVENSTHAWNLVQLNGQWLNVDVQIGSTSGDYNSYFAKTDTEYAELGHSTATGSYDPY